MSHRQELLGNMRAVRAELETIVAGYAGRLGEDMGDGWRVRDVLAHIALWERMAARKIASTPLPDGEDLLDGPWDLDRFNEAMRDRWRSRSDSDVQAEFTVAHQSLVAAVEGAREDECVVHGRVWQIIDEDGAGHYPHHFPVRDLLAQQAAQTNANQAR